MERLLNNHYIAHGNCRYVCAESINDGNPENAKVCVNV